MKGAPRLFWLLLGLPGLRGAVKCSGWFLMEAVSNHLGDSSHRLRGGVFGPLRFVPELSWQPFFILAGAVLAMQMHYNESWGYPGAEAEEESACSHLWLWICQPQGLGSHTVRIVPLGF